MIQPLVRLSSPIKRRERNEMQVEGEYQRWVKDVRIGSHVLFFTVLDTKGKETEVDYNLDKGVWICACEGMQYNGSCGHSRAAMEFALADDELKELISG